MIVNRFARDRLRTGRGARQDALLKVRRAGQDDPWRRRCENPPVTSTTGRTGDDGLLLLDRISDGRGEEQHGSGWPRLTPWPFSRKKSDFAKCRRRPCSIPEQGGVGAGLMSALWRIDDGLFRRQEIAGRHKRHPKLKISQRWNPRDRADPDDPLDRGDRDPAGRQPRPRRSHARPARRAGRRRRGFLEFANRSQRSLRRAKMLRSLAGQVTSQCDVHAERRRRR